MAGLLNTLKKNWRGLLDEVQAAPESLRALTQPAAAQQFDAALRKGGTIDKEKAVQMAMDVLQTTPMGVIGKIVYHGSPHKFDKFDMSKIGTGEGAQAYGHGLYMAESPEVAKEYARRLTPQERTLTGFKPGKSNLYKVDIPDEAIPRMLDWDKPLSQQAEVWKVLQEKFPYLGNQGHKTGEWALGEIGEGIGGLGPKLTQEMQQAGIPGIRYLDEGSRAAGEGTSNFVLFNDRLARILERNGQATGLQPWAPGEWKGLLD